MPEPASPPAPTQWLPQIERAVQQLQREEALRMEAQKSGQQPPAGEASPIFGELPGEGYLFAHDPETRQAALVTTTPEQARAALLRAIELCAQDVMPYGEQPPKELAQAALAFSQAYLLLDPSVDQEGVPVGAEAIAQADAQARVQAHASGQAFSHPTDANGYKEPPRVLPNPAEAAVAAKNMPKTEVLRGARADKPRPQPRVGG